jgi:hypothetical protein
MAELDALSEFGFDAGRDGPWHLASHYSARFVSFWHVRIGGIGMSESILLGVNSVGSEEPAGKSYRKRLKIEEILFLLFPADDSR